MRSLLQISDFIKRSANSYRVNLLAVDSSPPTMTKTFEIPIDETITKFMTSIRGKDVAVNITNPLGEQVNETLGARTLRNLDSDKEISITVRISYTCALQICCITS